MNLNILLWAPFGAGTHYWGPGTSAFRLYSNNNNENIKVTLVHGSDLQGDFPDVFVKQIQLGHIDQRKPLNMLRYLYNSYIWLKKNHKDYDVFHGITAYYFTFIPAYFSFKFNIPTFVKISGILGGFEGNGQLSKISGFSQFRLKNANKLDGYISISSDITKSLLNNGVETKRTYYIPNGVDVIRFRPLNALEKIRLRAENSIKNKFTILYLGGITDNKNVIETVFALNRLIHKGYDVQFVIVGSSRLDSNAENELHSYISKNNLEDSCIRIKHTTKPEVYYKIADAFVLNSKYEGLSNSLLEAMSSGLPCIAYPASGTVDLINDSINGYFTNGKSDEIFDALEKLYNNDALYNYLAVNARKTIIKRFSNQDILLEHIKVFTKKINEKL